MKLRYKIAVFNVLGYGWEQKRHYHIIAWEIGKPWRTYETILYYHPRKRLSHHFFKLILEARTNIKEAIKLVEYERGT